MTLLCYIENISRFSCLLARYKLDQSTGYWKYWNSILNKRKWLRFFWMGQLFLLDSPLSDPHDGWRGYKWWFIKWANSNLVVQGVIYKGHEVTGDATRLRVCDVSKLRSSSIHTYRARRAEYPLTSDRIKAQIQIFYCKIDNKAFTGLLNVQCDDGVQRLLSGNRSATDFVCTIRVWPAIKMSDLQQK